MSEIKREGFHWIVRVPGGYVKHHFGDSIVTTESPLQAEPYEDFFKAKEVANGCPLVRVEWSTSK